MTEPARGPSRQDLHGRRAFLRADGSPSIGLGHVMRLLALGQAWVDAGGVVEALIDAPTGLLERYRREGFDLHRVDRQPMRSLGDELVERLRDDASAVAAVDLPDLGLDDLGRLGDGAWRTLVIDDLSLLPAYPVGLVLNQNAHADPARYQGLAPDRLLMGLPYVLLRREFRSVPGRSVRQRAQTVLVTFGGGDPTGMTLRTLHAISALPVGVRDGLAVRVLVGAANRGAEAIAAFAAATADLAITVERDVADMVEPMAWADLAITSGGSTVWELARVGCPSIVVATAPAEVALTEGLEAVDLFDRMGSERDLDQARLTAAIDDRLSDVDWRRRMARHGQELVDGQGAIRVVDALASLDAR